MTENNERSGPLISVPVERVERRDTAQLDIAGDKGQSSLLNSEELIGIDHLGTFLESPPIAHSDRQTEADELEIDLKAETGYLSYADYVKAYSAKRYYLRRLLLCLDSPDRSLCKAHFTILDLIEEGSSHPRVVPRCHNTSAMRIVTALRQPPANVAVQIVLLNSSYDLSKDSITALRLGLQIDPRFFHALSGWPRRHFDPKHVSIDGAIATVIRCCDPEKLDTAPIVFIADLHWEAELAYAVDEEIGDAFPFQYPAVGTCPFYTDPHSRVYHKEGAGSGRYEHLNYARLLSWFFKGEGKRNGGVTDLVLQPLIPLFYLSIFRIRDLCVSMREEYYKLQNECYGCEREKLISGLHNDRLRLRVMVEDSEDALDHFLRYIRSQTSADLLLTEPWVKAEEELKRIHWEAARLDAQIRDYLQLYVGEMALKESRKSIELSNRQIDEGKRVKICKREIQAYNEHDKGINLNVVTVLAFVYVPLNLATSIFGMNLSELNGSGKKLWVFLTTAIVALLVTGASWFLIEEVNNYLGWQRKNWGTRTQFTIGARIGMLALLWEYRHRTWMWRSGAWWRILTDNTDKLTNQAGATNLSACEYVTKYSDYLTFTDSKAFEPNGMYEWV